MPRSRMLCSAGEMRRSGSEARVELADTWIATTSCLICRPICWLGEPDRALEELAKIAKTGIGVTYGDLRFNPAWDSIRDDPRFAQFWLTRHSHSAQ